MKGWKKGEIVVKREEIFKLRERESGRSIRERKKKGEF
jgi:hypothetical protein